MAVSAHVLIVDDDQDWRAALAILLESDGTHITEAADGQRALDTLESAGTFRLIILDLAMPVMDGSAFLARKARGAYAAIPVVIFSSSSFEGLERLADVVAVVPKIDGVEGLLAAIRSAEDVARPPQPPAALHA